MDSLLLSLEEVARLIVFSKATVENWSYRRKPAPRGFPQPIKVGRILRYRRADIERWIAGLGVTAPVTPGTTESDLTSDLPRPKRRARGRPRLSAELDRG